MRLLVRFWHRGYTPLDAIVAHNPETKWELSPNGGAAWRCPDVGMSLGELAMWISDVGAKPIRTEMVSQKNGRNGWQGEFIITFEWKETKEAVPQAVAAYLQAGLRTEAPVSVPGVGSIKGHGIEPPTWRIAR